MKGDFGESLANVLLGQQTGSGQLFETVAIGGKWPTIDIYAEIQTILPQKMFCFFQIKSTELGITSHGRLKVKINSDKLNKLAGFNAPTYLIGIDLNTTNPPLSNAYIKTIRGHYAQGIGSMPTTWLLNAANLILLRDEVEAYWTALNPLASKNAYVTNF